MPYINEYFTINSKILRKGYNWLLLSSYPDGNKNTQNHRNYHVIYILNGRVTYIFEDKEITANKGQAIVIHPNIPYRLYTESGFRKLDIVVASSEPRSLVFQELLKLSPKGIAITNSFNLNTSYEEFRQIITVPSDLNYILIRNKSEYMVLKVIEELSRIGKSDFRQKIENLTLSGEVNYNIKSLCELTGYSQTHFERLMVKHFGCSGIEYFNRIRINNICELLRNTTLTLPEIAAKNGFYDTSHLNTFFKKRMDTTPGKYRKMYIE